MLYGARHAYEFIRYPALLIIIIWDAACTKGEKVNLWASSMYYVRPPTAIDYRRMTAYGAPQFFSLVQWAIFLVMTSVILCQAQR